MVSSQREGHHVFLSVSDPVMGFWGTTTLKAEQILHITENGDVYMKNHTESWWFLRCFFHNGVILSDLTWRGLNEENTICSKLVFHERLLELLKNSTTFNFRAIYAGKPSNFSLPLQKGAAVLFLGITDAYSVFIALGSRFGDHHPQTSMYLWDCC